MTYSATEEEKKALKRTKIALMKDPELVFVANMMLQMDMHFSESIPTACTYDLTILFNPKFFMEQTPAKRMGLMAHEIMHPALLHRERRGHRTPKRYNVAGDYAINNMLVARGIEIPDGGYVDPKYDGMSTNAIYEMLPEEDDIPDSDTNDITQPNPNGGNSNGGNTPGNVPGAGNGPPPMTQTQIENVVLQAATNAKATRGVGSIPGMVAIELDKILNPKLPWHALTRRWLLDFNKNDFSNRKPNRRFFPEFHLPSMFSEALGPVNVYVDSSGSVSDSDFKHFVSETGGVLTMLNPKYIEFSLFDTSIRSTDRVHNLIELQRVKFSGRGGTLIEPVFNHINETKPKFSIIFTDGEFGIPETKVKTPILWIIYNNPTFKAPFGKVVHYVMD